MNNISHIGFGGNIKPDRSSGGAGRVDHTSRSDDRESVNTKTVDDAVSESFKGRLSVISHKMEGLLEEHSAHLVNIQEAEDSIDTLNGEAGAEAQIAELQATVEEHQKYLGQVERQINEAQIAFQNVTSASDMGAVAMNNILGEGDMAGAINADGLSIGHDNVLKLLDA